MMQSLMSAIALLLMLQTPNVLAHAGGHGPITAEIATSMALDVADQFANFDPGLGFGQLSSNWKGLARDASKVETTGNGYYIVSVMNKAEGKTLYVLISASGDVYDANFTGEFPKVK